MKIIHYASCFVVRSRDAGYEFLQLRRARGRFMEETWQLVTGGIEPGETAWQAALRELKEETALVPSEFYQVDVVNTFYLAATDSISQSPMFCAVVLTDSTVRLNEENTDYRWVPREKIEACIMWPGERAALREVFREILDDGPAKRYLRIAAPSPS